MPTWREDSPSVHAICFSFNQVCDNLSALQDSFLLDADKLTLSHTLSLNQTEQCEDTSPETRGHGARLEANFDLENQRNKGKAGETPAGSRCTGKSAPKGRGRN